jgi:hypothetical protein
MLRLSAGGLVKTMAKSRNTTKPASRLGRAPRSPPPFNPVVVRNAPAIRFNADDLSKLESSGGVVLSPTVRRDLEALAEAWCLDELIRDSARPKAFSALLNKTIRSLRLVAQAADLNPENAPATQLQLLNWILNSPVEGASVLNDQLQDLIEQITVITKTLDRLKQSLPADSGRARPHHDERRIKQLADIFESAGGKARVYTSQHAGAGMADTPFRRFARIFYNSLPIARPRAPAGFDNALRSAIAARRRKKGVLTPDH